MKEAGYVLYGIYVLLTCWLFLNGIVQLSLLWRARKQRKNKRPANWEGQLPFVSVQVPVYNEKYVVEGLLDTLASLDYPRHLYEIMVLDDSTDETTALIQQKAAALKEKNVNIHLIRRQERRDYKAGALQENLPQCKGELIAIFDADFRPGPDFIRSLLPHFTDLTVGLVQARWGHLNQKQNFLTRIQSYLLDTHFNIEQAGRQAAGYFINFCGTAGIWRKQCIEDAGGWDGGVLSEDFDLSYRAQLKGWKIVYDADVAIPAELPSEVEAFKIQQARWTKGIMQVFRKNGKAVAAAPMPVHKKLYAFFHLLSSFVFPCLFINSLLSLPLLLLRQAYPEFVLLTNIASVGSVNLLLHTIVFYYGVKATGGDRQFSTYFPVFLVVYMGLSVQNTVAVLQGIFGHRSAFVRTPKYADNKAFETSYFSHRKNKMHFFELMMLLYFVAGIGISFYLDDHFYLFVFIMMSCGLAVVAGQSFFLRVIRPAFILPKLQWRRLLFLFKYE